jgi:hypothetical protein
MRFEFLCASALMFVLASGHAVWGHRFILPNLRKREVAPLTHATFLICWHQATAMHLVSTVTLLIASLGSEPIQANALATVVLAMIAANFAVFFSLTAIRFRWMLKQIVPQIGLFALIISAIALGLRR